MAVDNWDFDDEADVDIKPLKFETYENFEIRPCQIDLVK